MKSAEMKSHISVLRTRQRELENSIQAVSLTLKISQREKADLEKKLAEARKGHDVLQAENQVLKANKATLQDIEAQLSRFESMFGLGRKSMPALSTPAIFRI